MKETEKKTATGKDSAGSDLQLLEQIISEAKAEAKRMISEAEQQAAKKLENSKSQRDSLMKEAGQRAEAQAEHYKKQKEAALRIDLKKLDLKAHEQIFDRVMEKTHAILDKMTASSKYTDVLIQLIAEGAIGLGVQEARIKAGAAGKKLLTKALLDKAEALVKKLSGEKVSLKLVNETLEEEGVFLSDKSGRIVFNNTLSARIDRRQNEIRRLVAENIELFPEAKGKKGASA